MAPPVSVDSVKASALPIADENSVNNNSMPPLPEASPVELPLPTAIKITEPIPETIPEFMPPTEPVVALSELAEVAQRAVPEVMLVETSMPAPVEIKPEVDVAPQVLEPLVSESAINPAPITLHPVTSPAVKVPKKLNKLVFIIAGVALLLIGVGV